MRKRLLGILFTAIVAVCLFPLMASADLWSGVEINNQCIETSQTIKAGTTFGTQCGIIKGEVKVQYYKAGTECSSYDDGADSMIVTLIGAEISTTEHICITCYIPTEIVLVNSNSLTTTGEYSDGIYTKADIVIKDAGNGEKGNLVINGTNGNTYAIDLNENCDVEFRGNIDVVLNGGKFGIEGDRGNEVLFNLTSGGKVTSTCRNDEKYAVCVGKSPTVEAKIGLLNDNRITTPTEGIVHDDSISLYIANKDTTAAKTVVIEGPAIVTPEVKPAGANTGDSNNIALFGIMGIIALCGAGFVYKRRED